MAKEDILDKNDWYGQAVETKSDPLRDSGSGNAVILRMFEFKANAEVLKRERPDKQQLFSNHANQIRMFLWKDGLEVADGIDPRVVVSKNKDNYRIFVGCRPKAGVSLVDKPKTLQELTTNNAT